MFESIDDNFTALLGWSADEVMGTSSLDLIHPDDHEAGIVAWIEMLDRPGFQTRVRQRFRSTSNEWLWCEISNTNHLNDPTIGAVEGEIVDISRELAAQSALQQRETLLQRLSQALPTGILHENVEQATVVSNDRWRELTGLRGTEGLNRLAEIVDEPQAVVAALQQARSGEDVDLPISFSSPLGCCRHGQLHLRPLGEDGNAFGLLATIADTTAMLAHQKELSVLARRDPLTGIYNRLGIEEVLGCRLDVWATPRCPCSSAIWTASRAHQ
ncbi:MAG: PAS domain-containing protein [Acidimicrobiia bacterium]